MGESVEPSVPKALDAAPPHIQAVIRAYAAFNARDLDGAVPELDEDRTCTTRGQLRARVERLIAAFPDARVSHLRAYDLRRGRVGVRFVLSGTNSEALAPDRGATNRAMQAEFLDFFEFDASGRIVDGQRFGDLDAVLRQLGVSGV